jgi:hypothetical protein
LNDSGSLAPLGDLSKPANTLIEKISDAIGGIFKPSQIRRVARAEADADMIHAATQIEITELQRRALHRFILEEARKQDNIESITSKALPEVSAEATPESVEDDWIVNFFDKCRLISDEQMQTLWARVLSGEANSPGQFSKRTVDLLASLDKADADAFTKLCSFAFFIGDVVPLIYDVEAEIYKDHGINFTVLTHLDSIGLLRFDALAGFVRRGFAQKGFTHYYGQRVWIEFQQPANNTLDLGHVLLTKTGQQLAPICGSAARDGFVEYVREKWRALGYRTEPAEQAASADG